MTRLPICAPRERKARASSKLVAPDRLTEAVSLYVDWEAFAYWARLALDALPGRPQRLRASLNVAALGFWMASSKGSSMLPEVPPNVGRG